MNPTRAQVVERIAVAIAELKGVALPRDLSQLQELEVDAAEATTAEQLRAIAHQVENLRAFLLGRKMSEEGVPAEGRPPRR